MRTRDVSNALKSRLSGMAGAPSISWPGVEFDSGVLPRFEVVFSARNTDDPTLKGGSIHSEQGVLRIIICTSLGAGENSGLDYFDDIRELFPKGLRVDITGGKITIISEPTLDGPAFPDETSYRFPVAIQYHAGAE